jgi:hypothetical protein
MPTFDLDGSSLFASLIWGGIGSAMFMFGWKQKSGIPLGIGMALVAISYFISSAVLMSVASVAVFVVMYCLKKQGY